MLNFTLKIVNIKDKTSSLDDITNAWRRAKLTSALSGEVDDLYHGRITALGGDNIASYEVYQFVDISAPTFYQAGANIVSIKPRKSFKWYAILQPFSWYVWILVIGTVPVCGLILYLIHVCSNDSKEEIQLPDKIWLALVIICWDSVNIRQTNCAIILFFIGLLIFYNNSSCRIFQLLYIFHDPTFSYDTTNNRGGAVLGNRNVMDWRPND